MGLLSFAKDAGEKIFGGGDSDEQKQKAIEEYIEKNNMFQDKVSARVDGSTIKLYGDVERAQTKAQLYLLAGNIEGVESVENHINIIKSAEQVAAPAEAPARKSERNESDEKVELEIDEDEVRYYNVKKGDTLSLIAQEFYGDPMQYPKIFEANKPMLTDPDKIYPGQKLIIPQ